MARIVDRDGKVRILDNEDQEVLNVTDDGTTALGSAAENGDIAFGDGNDILIASTTGTKIGQSGSKVGFYGVTPVVRPAALTQTYSTAAATNPNMTATAAATTAATATSPVGFATRTHADAVIASVAAMHADIVATKKFVNGIVDRLQALGLVQ